MPDTEPTAAVAAPVITLPAEIDIANADSIGVRLADACASGAKVVIADMSATTFCDSLGIRMLVQAWRQATDNDTELRLVVPCIQVLRVMEVLRFEKLLPIYRNLEQALAGPGANGQNPK